MKFPQLVVKLLDRPVSKGEGTVKSDALALGCVVAERLAGGASQVLVGSSSFSRGGIKSGTVGGSRSSRISDDPSHVRSSATDNGFSRSPWIVKAAAETVVDKEVKDSVMANKKNRARGLKLKGGRFLVCKRVP